MRVEFGDKFVVIRNEILWFRLVGAGFIIGGTALLWNVPAGRSLLEKSLVCIAGLFAVVLGGIGALRPMVTRVRVEGKDGLLIVHWRGLIGQSVEQIQASAVSSIDIDEDMTEDGSKRYALYVRLKTGRQLLLASRLHQKPVHLASQIETALGLRACTGLGQVQSARG